MLPCECGDSVANKQIREATGYMLWTTGCYGMRALGCVIVEKTGKNAKCVKRKLWPTTSTESLLRSAVEAEVGGIQDLTDVDKRETCRLGPYYRKLVMCLF